MKVSTAFALLLFSLAPISAARTIRRIELRGHALIYATDVPVRQGRLYLFHRYPDGVYMSVPADDVLGIASTTVEQRPKSADTVLLGPTGEGQPTETAAGARDAGAATQAYTDGYPGYYGYCYGCYVPPIPPPRPGPLPPPLVGPNGFPLMPGSPPSPPIGPNGFPILAPSPPPSPR